MAKKIISPKTVESLIHDEAKRINIPTAEHESVINQNDKKNIKIKYPRNIDLDPQLVWRGKDEQDWSDLVVNAPPIYIQEKVNPKALIDDLLRQTKEDEHDAGMTTADLFADFDGIPKDVDKTEFYSHNQNWTNRMILGDSLQVMASLAEREGLRGQVQCIYLDPPYGIKFNSNFQWSTTSRDVKDGESGHITREPEQVKAFRDTWRDGIHSYLTYLRDRLTVARDLLKDTGSIFVQIGDENVHRVRSLLEEVFGQDNFICEIIYRTNSPLGEDFLPKTTDYILWFAKKRDVAKYRQLFLPKTVGDGGLFNYYEEENGFRRTLTSDEKKSPEKISTKGRFYFYNQLSSSGYTRSCFYDFEFEGRTITALKNSWKTNKNGMLNLIRANRIIRPGKLPYMVGYHNDFPVKSLAGNWDDTRSAMGKTYVVETQDLVIQRCILMATDPGDLVLDPTCGSGTTAYIAEQWGRRWITIDTSRVALALARARIMGSKFPFYLLADSYEGQLKEAEASKTTPSSMITKGDLSHGFVYERVPHITLKSIANNAEIEIIYEKWKKIIFPLLDALSKCVDKTINEWDIPYDPSDDWSREAVKVHSDLLNAIGGRRRDIDKSIADKAEYEYLIDKPYEDKRKVRVAGPFTVESLSPHRVMAVDEDDILINFIKDEDEIPKQSFTQMILDNLKTSGVQQAHKDDKVQFTFLTPWPGNLVCAEGKYFEGIDGNSNEKRAAIFIGPEFGTVQKADLVQAAREAGDAGFDVLIACAFNYDAHATELNNLGRIPILKARMNADLHMSGDLKNTGKGNLFVIFGEPDIDVIQEGDGKIRVKVNGVDVFKPQTGEVVSDGADGIACWFIDTDYNEESFFVRQAYFLGANDPYSSLKTTLKAEINVDAWATLNSDISRAFPKPKSGRIAVKVINHLGDEVMKVFKA
jgi:adenine-specific DNA-methyltransferase